MRTATYVGNFKDQIDCDVLVDSIKSLRPDRRTTDNPYAIAIAGELDQELKAAKEYMSTLWTDAGYMKSISVEWLNYYPSLHFDISFVEKFSELVNAKPYNVWISSMLPGKLIPLHWDIFKDYQTHRHNPSVVRYSFFIEKPSIGKVFILEDEVFHMIPQGDVYKWRKWDEWHLGFNGGLDQKFMFHFVGFDRN